MVVLVPTTSHEKTSPTPEMGAQRTACALPVRPAICAVVLTMLCGLLFFHGLTAGDFYRTEGLRALVAAEGLVRGNWLVPTLYGEPYYTKPPGMYAAIALASWPTGTVTPFTARLPSALAASGTVLLFFWYFARQFGRRAGLVAALVLPTSFMWLDKVPTAEIDVLQVFWVTAAVLFFLRAVEADERDGRSGGWWLASLLCVAGGVLTKWTAPAFFYLAAVPLLWWRGRLRLLLGRQHLVAAGAAAAVCLAWIGFAVAHTGWDVFFQTVSREALQRLSPGHADEARRVLARDTGLGPWLAVAAHPFVVLATNLPWSAFALVTLRPGFAQRWDERGRFVLQALHCWTWPNLIFWSLLADHAPRHSFPLFGGIAGLAALVFIAWLDGRLRGASVPPRPRFGGEGLGVRGSEGFPPSPPTPLPRSGGEGRNAARVLGVLLGMWVVVKLVFVHAVVPARDVATATHAACQQLEAAVPEGTPVYLFKPHDDAFLFAYGVRHTRPGSPLPLRQVRDPQQMPSSAEPGYCIVDEPGWARWPAERPAEVVQRLDQTRQRPLLLVRVVPEVPGEGVGR